MKSRGKVEIGMSNQERRFIYKQTGTNSCCCTDYRKNWQQKKTTLYPNLPGNMKRIEKKTPIAKPAAPFLSFFAILEPRFLFSLKRLSQLGSICFFKGTTWSQRLCKVAHHWQFGLAGCTPEGGLTGRESVVSQDCMSQKGACLFFGVLSISENLI